MATSYQEWADRNLPRWLLRGKWAPKVNEVVYGLLDVVRSAAEDAAQIGFASHCPDDAVEHHARLRLLERLPGEAISALRARVLDAWNFWSGINSTTALENMLSSWVEGLGPDVYIFDFANDGWDAGATVDDDDDNVDNSSRHAIVVENTHDYGRPVVGPGLVVGPELLVGIDMPASTLHRIRAWYRKHRPANMVGIDLWILFDATTATDLRDDHSASADFVRIPLQRAMVGYRHHGMTVGPAMVVGQEFI